MNSVDKWTVREIGVSVYSVGIVDALSNWQEHSIHLLLSTALSVCRQLNGRVAKCKKQPKHSPPRS